MDRESFHAGGHFEPEVGCVVLRRCVACEAPHPLAVKSAKDKTRCSNLNCDYPPAEPGKEIIVKANVPGVNGLLARSLSAAGRVFLSLARKV